MTLRVPLKEHVSPSPAHWTQLAELVLVTVDVVGAVVVVDAVVVDAAGVVVSTTGAAFDPDVVSYEQDFQRPGAGSPKVALSQVAVPLKERTTTEVS